MTGRIATTDYKEAERRYVIEGHSIRQICRDMGMKSNSQMSLVSRREDWAGKRQAYMNSIARRSYENAAATVANENKAILDEAIMAGRATIRAYINQLAAKGEHVSSRDAHLWATFLMDQLSGVASPSTEVPDVRNVTPPDSDLLRRVVEAARERVTSPGSVGPTALVLPSDARPN